MRSNGYDYSCDGFYFITICVQNRDCLLGKIDSNKMILNNAGQMVAKWYTELKNKYPEIHCHEMVVMPNHFHCIIQIDGDGSDIALDGQARLQQDTCISIRSDAHATTPQNSNASDAHTMAPHDNDEHAPQNACMSIVSDAHAGAPLRGRPIQYSHTIENQNPEYQPQYGPNNKKYHVTVGKIVNWFKTMTTNEYIRGVKNLGWQRFDSHLWQRNYWDDIIRSDESLDRIAEYILHNPERWEEDKLNPERWNDETSDK